MWRSDHIWFDFVSFFSIFSGVKWKLMNGWQDLLMTSKIDMTSNRLKIHVHFLKLSLKKKSVIFKKSCQVRKFPQFSVQAPFRSQFTLYLVRSAMILWGKDFYRSAKWTCLDPSNFPGLDLQTQATCWLDYLILYSASISSNSSHRDFFSYQKTLFKYLDLINRIIQ